MSGVPDNYVMNLCKDCGAYHTAFQQCVTYSHSYHTQECESCGCCLECAHPQDCPSERGGRHKPMTARRAP